MDTSFIDVVGKIVSEGIKILIIAILIVIVLITLFNIMKERFLWGRMVASLHRSREVWLHNNENTPSTSKLLSFLQSMYVIYLTFHEWLLLRTIRPAKLTMHVHSSRHVRYEL
jgi:hypothetical protein